MVAFARELTPLNAFGVTFSTVSVLFVFSSDPLRHAFLHGGPVLMVWGWLLVSLLSVVTAVCLAEMSACMPAAVGSLYFFAARLAPWHSKALATWVAAWANLLAALGTTATYALVTTRTIGTAVRLARISASSLPYDPYNPSYSLTEVQEFGIYCAVLLSWMALVSAPLAVTAGFITCASLWQVVGGGALFGSLVALSPRRHSLAYVLSGWVDTHDSSRSPGVLHNVPYDVLVGLLFPVTALTGYETVLYFVEEMVVHRRRSSRWLDRRLGPAATLRRNASSPHHSLILNPQQEQSAAASTHPIQFPKLAAPISPSSSGVGGGGGAGHGGGDGGASGGGGGSGGGASLPASPSFAGRGPPGHTGSVRLPCSLSSVIIPASRRTVAATDPAQQQTRSGLTAMFREQQQQRLSQQQQQRAQSGRTGGAGAGCGGGRAKSVLPESIYGGLAASCLLALIYVVLLLLATPSLTRAVDPLNETLGEDPMSQVIYDILHSAYGSGRGSPGLIAVLAVGSYSAGLVCAAGTSRKLWAMATDGFVPAWLNRVSTVSRVPVRAAVVATAASLAPGLLILVGDWAASASLSYTMVAINGSYLLPVVLRLLPSGAAGYDAITRRVGRDGGFTLGRASKPCFLVSSLWLMTCCLLALLQPLWPPKPATANWAPVSSAAVAALVAASWSAPRWGARHWFRGLASVGGVSYW